MLQACQRPAFWGCNAKIDGCFCFSSSIAKNFAQDWPVWFWSMAIFCVTGHFGPFQCSSGNFYKITLTQYSVLILTQVHEVGMSECLLQPIFNTVHDDQCVRNATKPAFSGWIQRQEGVESRPSQMLPSSSRLLKAAQIYILCHPIIWCVSRDYSALHVQLGINYNLIPWKGAILESYQCESFRIQLHTFSNREPFKNWINLRFI